jgi:hypothetical protein
MKKNTTQGFDLDSIFKDAVRSYKAEKALDPSKPLNVIDYSTKLLNEKLTMAQTIILKLYYGGSRFNEDLKLTEKDYEIMKRWDIDQTWIFEGDLAKKKLHEEYTDPEKRKEKFEKREISYKKQEEGESLTEEDLNANPLWFSELILVLGRRSGKSYLTALISSYEAYKLIMLKDPQTFYGIKSDISIINTAVKQDQAEKIIFTEVKKFIKKCPVFDGRIDKFGTTEIRLFTDADLEYNKNLYEGEKPKQGSILILCGSSSSSGLRGHTPICVIYDELAHFVNTDGKSSSKEVYTALSKSSATFKIFGDGRQIIISSPYDASGFFYDLYNKSKNIKSMCMFQIPTWNANPRVPKSELLPEYELDFEAASVEYGAQFRKKSTFSYFPEEKIQKAMFQRENWIKHKNGVPGYQYYLHIDAADSSDRYAFMVLHTETRYDPELRFNADFWVEDYSFFMNPRLNNGQPLDPDFIVDEHVMPMFKYFNIGCVSFDGMLSREQRKKIAMKCPCMKEIRFAGRQKNIIYDNTRNKLMSGRIELCMDDVELEGEMKCIKINHGKTPPVINKDSEAEFPHDDLVDCLCGAIYASNKTQDGFYKLPPVVIARTGKR